MVALLSLAGLQSASAQVEIQWEGPPECEGSGEVEAEIARLLPGAEERAPLVAHVRASQSDDVWRVEVRLTEGESELGQRNFEAATCAELRGAVALLIVLAVDPDALIAMEGAPEENGEARVNGSSEDRSIDDGSSEEHEGDASAGHEGEALPRNTEAAGDAADHATPEAADRLTPPDRNTARVEAEDPDEIDDTDASGLDIIIEPAHWGLEARVGVDFGSLPSPTPVFSLGAFHQRHRFALGLAASIALPQNASTDVLASGRLAYGALRATPGLRFRLSRLVLDVRGVVEVGVMGGRGQDVEGPQTGYSLWAALGLEAGIAFRVGPISLGISGDVRLPLNRPLYAFRGPLDVHRTAAVVGRTEISLGLHFQ